MYVPVSEKLSLPSVLIPFIFFLFVLRFLIDQITRTPTLKNKSTSNSKRSFLQARRHSNSEVGKTAPSAQSAGLLAEESWQEDGLVEYEIDALLVQCAPNFLLLLLLLFLHNKQVDHRDLQMSEMMENVMIQIR